MAVAAGEEVEQCEVYWAKERRGCFWPCQVGPYAMVPQEVVRKFGQVVREGITWFKLFGKKQFKLPGSGPSLATPLSTSPPWASSQSCLLP